LYLRAEGGTIPELKRVIVAHENRVAMAETLDAALAALFSGSAAAAPAVSVDSGAAVAPRPNATAADNTAALVREAGQHYDRAIAAQRAGDWAGYGREMQELGRVLGQLKPRR
jgi:uncharacterized membrane protein (UPF0182 family)